MDQPNEQALAARELLASAFFGVLSTHSREHAGYPFGSVCPYVLDSDGYPILLLSHLAQHTKNLEADPKCSLTLVEPGSGDVQQRSRLTAIGAVEPQNPDKVSARFFRYYPQSGMYFGQLGFRFYRYRPIRFHWNAGFATARWFSEKRVILPNPLNPEQEAQLVQQLNDDHMDTLLGYLQGVGQSLATEPPVVAVGVDGLGIDLRQDARLIRIKLPGRIANPVEVREVLVEMTPSARD